MHENSHEAEPTRQQNEVRAGRRGFSLLVPSAFSAFTVFLMWTEMFRVFPKIFAGIGALIFCLSPLFAVYTICIAVVFKRRGEQTGLVLSLCFLVPLAFASFIAIMWLIYGVALQT